ncbi:MAG: DUF3566 domain-containing protein [Acidimicrobiales bacterium]
MRHVDTWSVCKVSAIFYLIAVAVLVVASLLLWTLADVFGIIHSIERSVRTLFDLATFKLRPVAVIGYTAVGGTVLALVGTGFNVLAALTYNLISDVIGGVQIIVVGEPEG